MAFDPFSSLLDFDQESSEDDIFNASIPYCSETQSRSRSYVRPYHLDEILFLNRKQYSGNGGTRGWFHYCIQYFNLDLGYYCDTEQELKYAIWLYFTVKYKIPIHQRKSKRNGNLDRSYEYSCKMCGKSVFTGIKKCYRSRSGEVDERWTVDRIDKIHHQTCNQVITQAHQRGSSRIKCMHLDDLIHTIMIREGGRNSNTRETTVEILQDIYLGKAIRSTHASSYTEIDRHGNIHRISTDQPTYHTLKAGRERLLRMTRTLFH